MNGIDFNHQTNGFSVKNMAFLAKLADLAYSEDVEDIKKELNSYGFNVSSYNFFIECEVTDTQGFIAADQEKIIVSFRGSEKKLEDWRNNLKFDKKKFHPVGLVHKGFYEALNSVWPDVSKIIKTLQTNKQSVWFTGHSLGGALASLAAATMQLQEGKDVNGVYTFGQPRVGDNKFSAAYDQKLKDNTWLVVNNHDVVSRVLPRNMNYSHVGKLIYFDQDGQLRQDVDLSWWKSFWGRFTSRFSDLVFDSTGDIVNRLVNLPPAGIADHDRKEYVRLTAQAAKS